MTNGPVTTYREMLGARCCSGDLPTSGLVWVKRRQLERTPQASLANKKTHDLSSSSGRFRIASQRPSAIPPTALDAFSKAISKALRKGKERGGCGAADAYASARREILDRRALVPPDGEREAAFVKAREREAQELEQNRRIAAQMKASARKRD